ncbi:hypothetical protein COV13_01075 [Candidatus Woesearchaeota archaeon CG10_big_fil_rev_8_21_14_0_10_32_9]|nr:MAG: hypothetical protein COV13_01075 [Candidatus Woesearchaeota archaeon CG10_big_fil_rev_8_21_14_0_10_32_9]
MSVAKKIDDIDMFLGPFTSALKLSGSEHLQSVGWWLDVGELSLKTFFAGIYVIESRNYSSLLDWVPREIIATLIPYGGLLDISRSYERVVREDYHKRVDEYLANKISVETLMK